MRRLLELWEQAGERPYEVLIEEGLYDEFLRELNSSLVQLDGSLLRGTRRHQELTKGRSLDYTYPTAWSTSFESAFHFVEEEERPVILSLSSKRPIKGVFNPYNTYQEEEVILAPLRLRVTERYDYDDYILLEVIPSDQ